MNQPMLSKRHEAFVRNYVANGGDRTAAAAEAGYRGAGIKSSASRLLHNPLIQQAILIQTKSEIGLHAASALAKVVELMSAAKSDFVKLEAAKDLLDRAGLSPPPRVVHAFDGGLTVTLELGGSKTADHQGVTLPRTGKSPPELDGSSQDMPEILDRQGLGGDFSASQSIDLTDFVEISTSEDVVFPKTGDGGDG